MSTKKVLTTGEIAEHCGVNFRTVIRWIERGQLESYKLPGRGDNRVSVDEFLRFLTSNNMPVPDEFADNRRSVLVVDDDRPMASAIARLLTSHGYDVDTANDGFQAGTKLQSLQPKLMTLDLSMPGLDGFQVLEFVRSQYTPALRILVVSALDEQQLSRAAAAGADAVMSKPFSNEKLLEQVANLIAT